MSFPSAVPGFNQIGVDSALGVPYAAFENEHGTSLQLTEQGVTALGDIAFAKLVSTMAATTGDAFAFTGRDVMPTPGFSPLKMGGREADVFAHGPTKTVIKSYSPDGAPGAPLQLNTMSWLHGQLEKTPAIDTGLVLRAPKQYGLITSPSGQKRTLMERAPGQPLQTMVHHSTHSGLSPEAKVAIATELPKRITTELTSRLGRGAMLLNDTRRHTSNFLVSGDPLVRPEVAVIDQPFVMTRGARLRTRLLFTTQGSTSLR